MFCGQTDTVRCSVAKLILPDVLWPKHYYYFSVSKMVPCVAQMALSKVRPIQAWPRVVLSVAKVILHCTVRAVSLTLPHPPPPHTWWGWAVPSPSTVYIPQTIMECPPNSDEAKCLLYILYIYIQYIYIIYVWKECKNVCFRTIWSARVLQYYGLHVRRKETSFTNY